VVIPLFMGFWGTETQGTLLSVSLYTSAREVSRKSTFYCKGSQDGDKNKAPDRSSGLYIAGYLSKD
jgi:hypothetical protein